MIDLFTRQKFFLRPTGKRDIRDKTPEECVHFWASIKERLKKGELMTDPRKFSFGRGFCSTQEKIKYCDDMIFLIKHGVKVKSFSKNKIKV